MCLATIQQGGLACDIGYVPYNAAANSHVRCERGSGHTMFATVNGVDIHYTVAGSGIPCLVPSIAGTPIYERTFASPTLLQQLRLIFVELRANRTAVGDVEALTLGTLVDDLDGLRRA